MLPSVKMPCPNSFSTSIEFAFVLGICPILNPKLSKLIPSSNSTILPTPFGKTTRCLKITEKVSFFASEASYVNILSGQKFIKNANNGPIWRVFENLKLAVKQCYQTV